MHKFRRSGSTGQPVDIQDVLSFLTDTGSFLSSDQLKRAAVESEKDGSSRAIYEYGVALVQAKDVSGNVEQGIQLLLSVFGCMERLKALDLDNNTNFENCCLYFISFGYFRLQKFSKAKEYGSKLLEREPNNKKMKALVTLADEFITNPELYKIISPKKKKKSRKKAARSRSMRHSYGHDLNYLKDLPNSSFPEHKKKDERKRKSKKQYTTSFLKDFNHADKENRGITKVSLRQSLKKEKIEKDDDRIGDKLIRTNLIENKNKTVKLPASWVSSMLREVEEEEKKPRMRRKMRRLDDNSMVEHHYDDVKNVTYSTHVPIQQNVLVKQNTFEIQLNVDNDVDNTSDINLINQQFNSNGKPATKLGELLTSIASIPSVGNLPSGVPSNPDMETLQDAFKNLKQRFSDIFGVTLSENEEQPDKTDTLKNDTLKTEPYMEVSLTKYEDSFVGQPRALIDLPSNTINNSDDIIHSALTEILESQMPKNSEQPWIIIRRYDKRGGKKIQRPNTLQELLEVASQRFNFEAAVVRELATEAEIEDVRAISDNSVVWVLSAEDEKIFEGNVPS